jgi:hypothetical protein
VQYFTADVKGLMPGAATTPITNPYKGQTYTYATRNPAVARAFAIAGERSTYHVQLDPPILHDPYIKQRYHTGFVMSNHGLILDVYGEEACMTLDEAREVMSKYGLWAIDDSQIFDKDGYANVPPGMNTVCTAEDLHQLGQYPAPPIIMALANHLAAQKGAPQ